MTMTLNWSAATDLLFLFYFKRFQRFHDWNDISPPPTLRRVEDENAMDFHFLWHEIIIFQRARKSFVVFGDFMLSRRFFWGCYLTTRETFDSEINWQKLCLSWAQAATKVEIQICTRVTFDPFLWGAKNWQTASKLERGDHARDGIIYENFFNFIRASAAETTN